MKIIKKLGAVLLAITLTTGGSIALAAQKETAITDFHSGKTEEFLENIEKGNYPESIEYTRNYESKKKYSITDEQEIKAISDALVQIEVGDIEDDVDDMNEDKLVCVDEKGNEFSFRFRDHKLYYESEYYSLDGDDDLWELLDKQASGSTSSTTPKKDDKYISQTAEELGLTYDMPKDWTVMTEEDGSVTLAVDQNETTFWFPAIQIFEILNYSSADEFFEVTEEFFKEKYPDKFKVIQESKEETGFNYPVSSFGMRYDDGAGLLVRYSYVVQIGDRWYAVESMEDQKSTKEVEDIMEHVINSLKPIGEGQDDSLTNA